jgi:hypothetical protein
MRGLVRGGKGIEKVETVGFCEGGGMFVTIRIERVCGRTN